MSSLLSNSKVQKYSSFIIKVQIMTDLVHYVTVITNQLPMIIMMFLLMIKELIISDILYTDRIQMQILT